MALNKVFQSTQALHREREVGANVAAGTPLIEGGRPAITLTASGGTQITKTVLFPDGPQDILVEAGGVGNLTNHATVAYDGTFELPVTGATTSTASDVKVFITGAGEVTLADGAGANTLFGYTDYPRDYTKVAGRAPVRIGA